MALDWFLRIEITLVSLLLTTINSEITIMRFRVRNNVYRRFSVINKYKIGDITVSKQVYWLMLRVLFLRHPSQVVFLLISHVFEDVSVP